MSKLYFGSTNAGYLTIAVDENSKRACYLHEDGTEGKLYPSKYELAEMSDSERETVCARWLREIAEYNDFDSLYMNCDVASAWCGVYTSADALDELGNIDVYASIDF